MSAHEFDSTYESRVPSWAEGHPCLGATPEENARRIRWLSQQLILERITNMKLSRDRSLMSQARHVASTNPVAPAVGSSAHGSTIADEE